MKLFSTIGSKIDGVFNSIGDIKDAYIFNYRLKAEQARREELIAKAVKEAEFQAEVQKQLKLKTEA
jgi:hypothetical protein